jgi:hypothetical protein
VLIACLEIEIQVFGNVMLTQPDSPPFIKEIFKFDLVPTLLKYIIYMLMRIVLIQINTLPEQCPLLMHTFFLFFQSSIS